LTEQKFDVIVSQPSHPWTAGASHLFTREFFALARERLEPDGVLLQWIGLNLVDAEALKTLSATLHDGFAHVETFCPAPGAAALYLASARPLELNADAAAQAVAATPLWRALGVRSGDDLQIARVLDDQDRAFFQGARLNTDHHNLLATRSPFLARRHVKATLAEIEAAWSPFDPLPETPGVDRVAAVARLLDQGELPRARRLAMAIVAPLERELAFALIDLVGRRRQQGAEALVRLANVDSKSLGPRRALVRLWQDEIKAGKALPKWLELDPATAALVSGWVLQNQGQDVAIAALEDQLKQIGPRDLLFAAATRLRIAWRQASADPARAREAIELLDPLLAERATPADLQQRAELGRLAGDAGIEAVSRAELALFP
jgi:spermidine synthase